MKKTRRVGWTEAEYTPAVGRLHDRILDLEDAIEAARAFIGPIHNTLAEIALTLDDYGFAVLYSEAAEADKRLRDIDRLLSVVGDR